MRYNVYTSKKPVLSTKILFPPFITRSPAKSPAQKTGNTKRFIHATALTDNCCPTVCFHPDSRRPTVRFHSDSRRPTVRFHPDSRPPTVHFHSDSYLLDKPFPLRQPSSDNPLYAADLPAIPLFFCSCYPLFILQRCLVPPAMSLVLLSYSALIRHLCGISHDRTNCLGILDFTLINHLFQLLQRICLHIDIFVLIQMLLSRF